MAGTKRGTQNRKIEQTEAKVILEVTKDLDLNKVVAEVGGLQVNVQNSLAALSAALTAKIQQAEQLDQAITLKEQRLHELFNIEAGAVTLDDMKAQKDQEEKDWELRRVDRSRIWQEEEIERSKRWKRDSDEHEYNTQTHQKKITDEFDAEVAGHRRNEAARQEMLTKSWTERENTLKAREQELTDLRKQVETFDVRLKQAITAAETALGSKLRGEYDHELKLMVKDSENEKSNHQIKLTAYEMTVRGLEDQIKDLKVGLASARQDAKEVASQALQSASQRGIAEALQRVVDNGGRDTPSGKK